MSVFFASLLVAHVLFGIVGVILIFMVTFMLLKKELQKKELTCTSFGAFLAYIISWFSGGWYYWKYYGTTVKPAIMAGEFRWAHSIIMEVKEHIFLFLPFASLALALVIYLKFDALLTDQVFRRKVIQLSIAVTVLAIIITLSGVLITGGAR